MVWIILPFVVGGLVAWARRPESRFGVLMLPHFEHGGSAEAPPPKFEAPPVPAPIA